MKFSFPFPLNQVTILRWLMRNCAYFAKKNPKLPQGAKQMRLFLYQRHNIDYFHTIHLFVLSQRTYVEQSTY